MFLRLWYTYDIYICVCTFTKVLRHSQLRMPIWCRIAQRGRHIPLWKVTCYYWEVGTLRTKIIKIQVVSLAVGRYTRGWKGKRVRLWVWQVVGPESCDKSIWVTGKEASVSAPLVIGGTITCRAVGVRDIQHGVRAFHRCGNTGTWKAPFTHSHTTIFH